MNNRWRLAAILWLAVLLAHPGTVCAERLFVGLNFGMTQVVDAAARDDQGRFTLVFAPAAMGGVVVGWQLPPESELGDGRLELEYSRRSNPLDKVALADGTFGATGELTVESLLLNTFGVQRDGSNWTPYLGLGLGAARISAEQLQVTGQPLSNDSAIVLAYQLGGGFDLAVSESLSLDLGYRFFSTLRPRLREADGRVMRSDYLSHTALLGLRLLF